MTINLCASRELDWDPSLEDFWSYDRINFRKHKQLHVCLKIEWIFPVTHNTSDHQEETVMY